MISLQPLVKIDGLLARFGVITWVSIILGTIVPALAANHYGVFYKSDLEKRRRTLRRKRSSFPSATKSRPNSRTLIRKW
jgi:hypothetical protein